MTDARMRPARPGCSVANPRKAPGTLGCIVRDLPPYGGIYILSSAHVIGNETFEPLGLGVLQPGKGSWADEGIGVVSRWGSLYFTDDTYPNLFDAAIASVDASAVTSEIPEIGKPTGINENISKDAVVRKFGAKTQLTTGLVAEPFFHCAFAYTDPDGNGHRAGFQQQILCTGAGGPGTPFSEGGDSGSAVVDEANRVVGLITGTVKSGTVVCPIGPILYALKVTLA